VTDVTHTAAVVVAGGIGERFGRPGGKQLAEVAGCPVLGWSLRALDASARFSMLVVVCLEERMDEYAHAVMSAGIATPLEFAPAGVTRQDSVSSGLSRLSSAVQVVAIHDGARPLVTPQIVAAALDELDAPGACGVVVGHPSVDTVKIVQDGRVDTTPERDRVWIAQTPQVFIREVLESAYSRAKASGLAATDDASLVERLGRGSVRMIEGPRENIKVTVAGDLEYVATVLARRGEGVGA